MTINTSDKPGTVIRLIPGKWVTVAIGKVPAGAEMHGMLYANVSGRSVWAPGSAVQVDVRALRNGEPEFLADGKTRNPKFDETCLDGRCGSVQNNRTWRARMTQPWFGGDPGDTFHFQLMVRDGSTGPVEVKGSRYAKMMNN